MNYINTLEFAQQQDAQDSLAKYRTQFLFPHHHGKQNLYFTGNSLGLQPKAVLENLKQELNDWAQFGVEGHFLAKNPWVSYHEILTKQAANIVGALPSEVVMMNQLTVNLHLLLISFYRPTMQRYKIICEAKAFPSDQYALESQVKLHGFLPEDAIIEVAPREGVHCILHEDILEAIEKNKNELALVMIGGVNYYNGQVFDMEAITRAGHAAGALVGFDLAHAAGNLVMRLHDWKVDFACWCSYKYLNSGPGGVAGAFVHQMHESADLPRLAGWWGHDKVARFKMEKGFVPMKGAEGWQLSNAPVLSMAACKASLDIFEEAGMSALASKRDALTGYLEFLIDELNAKKGKYQLEIITPRDKKQRGAQLSLLAHGGNAKAYFNSLTEGGVISDWREPNVIRVAPAPLYNSFEDVWRMVKVMEAIH
jgi:kynureninase